jgi:branched-chain amino acid transport system substrate-binding protein
MKRFADYPRMGSLVGYATMLTVAEAFRKAGSTNSEAFVEAMHGLEVESPVGSITFRTADQQSTMGAYVGRLTVKDGMPRMSGWRYGDGADYLPPESEAAKMRPTS